MKSAHPAFWLVALVLLLLPAYASAQVQGETNDNELLAQRLEGHKAAINSVFPLPSSRLLSDTERAGKNLFLQACSTCHLPGLPVADAYAPILDSKVLGKRGEDGFRQYTLVGSRRMPGWQYMLQPGDVDKIIAYMKTLTYDPAARKYIHTPGKK